MQSFTKQEEAAAFCFLQREEDTKVTFFDHGGDSTDYQLTLEPEDIAPSVEGDHEYISNDFNEFKGSLAGASMKGMENFLHFSLTLRPYEEKNNIANEIPSQPYPGTQETPIMERGLFGLNTAYVAMLRDIQDHMYIRGERVLRVGLVGIGRGSVLRCICYQSFLQMRVVLMPLPYEILAARLLLEAYPVNTWGRKVVGIDVLEHHHIHGPPPGGRFDILIINGVIHTYSQTLVTHLIDEWVTKDGSLLALYPDALKAPYLQNVPGFQFKKVVGDSALVTIGGKEFLDPVFSPPLLDARHFVLHGGHQDLVLHLPYSEYIPRAMKDKVQGGIGRYFNVYRVDKGLGVDMRFPPHLEMDEGIIKVQNCPYPRSYFMEHVDRAVGATHYDLQHHIMSGKYYFKDKYDGKLIMACHGSQGLFLYDLEQDTYYRVHTTPFTRFNECKVAQYELVNAQCQLCSVNAYIRQDTFVPMSFEDRHRSMLPWFNETWKPLAALRIENLQRKEGIVLCAALVLRPCFRHYGPHGARAVVGASIWIKHTPTADCLINGECVEIDIKTGHVTRDRPGKQPNDLLRLGRLMELATIEELFVVAPLNGIMCAEQEEGEKLADSFCRLPQERLNCWTGTMEELKPSIDPYSGVFMAYLETLVSGFDLSQLDALPPGDAQLEEPPLSPSHAVDLPDWEPE